MLQVAQKLCLLLPPLSVLYYHDSTIPWLMISICPSAYRQNEITVAPLAKHDPIVASICACIFTSSQSTHEVQTAHLFNAVVFPSMLIVP